MKPQFDNQVMSSFFLWFDHTLTRKGEAFENHGSNFYKSDSLYNGYVAYAAPFKPFVSDKSVGDATVISGVYVDGTFTPTGSGNLAAINYEQGRVYFSSEPEGTISGDYSIKDFSVQLTDKNEGELIFETKFQVRPKTFQNITTGASSKQNTVPAVFIKNNGGENVPFSFGGQDETKINVRAVVLADSQFDVDAVCSIFRDQKYELVPLFEEGDMPFNFFGDFRSGKHYDYRFFATGTTHNNNFVYLDDVRVTRFGSSMPDSSSMEDLNPEIYTSVIDFDLTKPRFPRQEC
tara:strand:- start:967 stop:1839 length:873 start_codon:yes stop_codon:yes gene_type:complete